MARRRKALAAPPALDPAERTVEELFGRPLPVLPALAPSMDILERGDEIVVRAAVPGVKKEDIDVSVSGTLLTVRCEPRDEKKGEEGEFYRHELPRGPFSRSLTLPAEVDESKAKATLRDGILELRLPKPEKLRRHRIRID